MAGVGMLYMTFVLPPLVEMTEVVKDMPTNTSGVNTTLDCCKKNT
jgi:hypothetical protein